MECNICEKEGDLNFKKINGENLCEDCYKNYFDKIESNSLPEPNILSDCVDYFYNQNNGYSFNYYLNRFNKKIINDYKLGYAPNHNGLYRYLKEEKKYTNKQIMSTGLFFDSDYNNDLYCSWRGRFVFPYYNENGEVAYLIGRESEKTDDNLSGKYVKIAHTKKYCEYDEIIFGKETLTKSKNIDKLFICEGICDALKLIEKSDSPVLSPVTTQFKKKHIPIFIDIIQEYNIKKLVFIPDIEPPSEDDIEKYGDDAVGPGLKGTVITSYKMNKQLNENNLDVSLKIMKLSEDNSKKIDLEEYLNNNSVEEFEKLYKNNTYNFDEINFYEIYKNNKKEDSKEIVGEISNDNDIYDLKLTDVSNLSSNYRGKNPIEHIGESENYFKVINNGETAYDFKSKQTYNAYTYILHKIGERQRHNIEGKISDEEFFKLYKYCSDKDIIKNNNNIPNRIVKYIAKKELDKDNIPINIYHACLDILKEKYDIEVNKDINYKDEIYWEYRPKSCCNSELLHYKIKSDEEYNTIKNIEFKDISEQKTLWKTEDIDYWNESTLYYYIVKNNININNIDKYSLLKISEEKYYNTLIDMWSYINIYDINKIDERLKKYFVKNYEGINYKEKNNNYMSKKSYSKCFKIIEKDIA